ncbi:MAG: sigma factor, partial [Planctomycetota bacterium]
MLFDSQDKLVAAKRGDETARGELLDRFRPYLNVIAQRMLDDRIQGRLDFADVVQATFMEASRDFDSFRGESVESFLAWLRNILRNNIATAHQEHLVTQKRSARREISMATPTGDPGSEVQLANILPAETSTPSQRIMRD